MTRRRRGLSKHDLTELEHSCLVQRCLMALGVDARRPAGSYEQRIDACERLESIGYLRESGTATWAPTVAGLEASGLLGPDGGVEVDP